MKVSEHISPVSVEERKSADIKTGDTVRVWQKIREGDKTRLQAFEGLVIAKKHGTEPGATFTVRRVVNGMGVEKIFPLYSPMIDKLEVVKRSNVRRSKLYYVREKAAREIRKKIRQMKFEAQEVIMAESKRKELLEQEEAEQRKEEEKVKKAEAQEKAAAEKDSPSDSGEEGASDDTKEEVKAEEKPSAGGDEAEGDEQKKE